MSQVQEPAGSSLRSEIRLIARRGVQVWRIVPARQKLALGGAVVVMAVASAAATSIFLGIGWLVNAVNIDLKDRSAVSAAWPVAFWYLALIGLAYLIRETFNVLRRYLVESTCTRIDRDLCVKLVSHLMRVDLSRLSHEQVGALHGRISRSVEGLVRFLRISFLDFVPAILTGSFALVAALAKQPKIALAMLCVAPISLVLTICQLMTQRGVRVGLLRCREKMDGTVVEQLAGIDYVRAANTYSQEIARVEKVAESRRSKELRHHFEMSLFGSGKALNEGAFHLIVVGFAVWLFLQGTINYGDIMALSMLFLNVMAPLNEVHRFIDEAHESSLKIGDLMDLMDEPEDRSFAASATREPVLAVGAPVFECDGLVVDYRTAAGELRRAVDGVSARLYHGETIGVAGRSGCGKTTWLRVLMRLAHPSEGSAALGGVALETISREAIGRTVGYVGQNPFVFSGTVSENIAYGSEGTTDEQIKKAAKLACIHKEITAMPGGYNARVAERGQNLSGGQRQRIALARVFLKNPPILILDEGTSALDNISEQGPAGHRRRPRRPHGDPRRAPPDHPARRRPHPRV